MLDSNRYWELDFIRGVSIVAVIMIHVSASICNSDHVLIAIVLNQLSRFSVPAFLFVSGILAYRSYTKQNIKHIWKKRALNILTPYLIWSTIGLIISKNYNIKNLIFTYLFGLGEFYQLYYIVLLVQFYLLLPFFIYMANKFSRVIIILGISCCTTLIYDLLIRYGININIINCLMKSTILSWMGYFIVGCYIGKNYNQFIQFLKNHKLSQFIIPTSLSIAILALDEYNLLFVKGFKLTEHPIFNFFRIDIILFAFCTIFLLFKIADTYSSNQVIKTLYDNSFGIYLNHIMILTILKRFFNHYLFNNLLEGLISIIIILLISILLNKLIKKIPYLRLFLLGINQK